MTRAKLLAEIRRLKASVRNTPARMRGLVRAEIANLAHQLVRQEAST